MTVGIRAVAALAWMALLPATAIAQNPVPGELAVGTPEGGDSELGQSYFAEEHGDWQIRCIRVEEGQPEPCQLYQLLVDEGDSPVAEVTLFDVPNEGEVVAGATIVTPLDTLLSPQLRMRVDDGPVLRYPFSFCQPVGCFVRLGLTAGDIESFRAGAEAVITIVPLQAPDQTVDVVMSLRGFTNGFEALDARVVAAQEALQALQEAEEDEASE